MNRNIVDNYDLNCSSFSYLNEDENENNNDKSINGTPLSDDVKENSKFKGVIGKIGGIGADSNEQTRNGRRYPLELWQNVEKSEYFIEGMQNRSIIGEADHPQERVDYSVTEGAVVLTKYDIQNDGKVYTEFDILDTLPGRTVKAYFDAGCRLGVSSRGLGEEIMRNGETIIDPDTYQFYCFDVVAFPAVKTARMELLESTSPKRTRYIESMKREIEKCTNTDELKFIEDSAKGADLYLDEIREAVENKSDKLNESFKYDNTDFTSIKDLDEPEKAYQATKTYLDQLKKLKYNASENDKYMMGWLEAELKDYEEYKQSNDIKTEDVDIKNSSNKFKYMLLDRLKRDCEYFLNNPHEKHLWAGNIEEHIKAMKEIYEMLVEKPEWLSLEDIDKYEQDMLAKRNSASSLNEDLSKHYTGNWTDICNELSKDGYAVDSVYRVQPSQDEEEIIMYKDGKTYKASVNKYFDGSYEILKDTIKKENNKIKISEPKFNKSDEDTPEVLDRDSDENLEILAEIQECINVKNSKINTLNEQQKRQTEAIKTLVAKLHSANEALQSKINENQSLLKKYENLRKVNEDFSKMFESLKTSQSSIISKNKFLQEKITNYNNQLEKSSSVNTQLRKSLGTYKQTSDEITKLTESISTLENNQRSLIKSNKKLEAINQKNEKVIAKLNEKNAELKNNYNISLEKYIESICLKYKLQKETLKRLLGENYTFKDIDNVASKMVDNISKMKSLPFSELQPSRQIVYENLGLRDISNNSELNKNLETFNFMLNTK